MRKDLTDITVVLDRSGSMVTIKEEAENGLNQFVGDQKTKPGSANFTLVKFDDQYECQIRGVPIQEVGKCLLEPRGWTALNDAVARAIKETGDRLAAIKEADRPGLVVFAILTDGCENHSKEFAGPHGRARVKEMIEHQQKEYAWKFVYLGSNQDAFAEAASLGIPAATAAAYDNARAGSAYCGLSSNVARSRVASAAGLPADLRWEDGERKAMISSDPKDKPKASV